MAGLTGVINNLAVIRPNNYCDQIEEFLKMVQET
jgi:hypothetical protein